MYADIKRLYDDRVIEAFIIGIESIDTTLKRTKEAVLQSSQKDSKFQLITDTITELQGWACFRQEQVKMPANSFTKKERKTVYSEPKRNPAVKVENVGRNDPCTCGSGKKYKKCCGV